MGVLSSRRCWKFPAQNLRFPYLSPIAWFKPLTYYSLFQCLWANSKLLKRQRTGIDIMLVQAK